MEFASMNAVDKALRNATGLVQGWIDAAVPWTARNAHIQRGFAF
ncbi:MAG TPA: hypothetical protein VN456_13690 [Desulfosporosinus sp.]|nr:hypothetical protein [Desulfosporosinus sp.]